MPFVELERARFHYQSFGQGPHVILAFHGYGQDSGHFQVIAEALRPTSTIYAFDLFFHGKSKLPKSKMPLQKRFLQTLIKQFLEEKKISSFSVLAFSMGGKFALSLIEGFPTQIDRVLLVAPDGIRTNFWYSMATYPGFLSGLFKRTVLKPTPFFKFVNFLERKKIVDRGLVRFANWHMESTPKRLRVYRSWVGFSKLNFDIRKIVRILNEHQIELTMFLGEFDQVIPQRSLQVFIKAVQKCRVIVLKTGHALLLHDVAYYLRRHQEIFR
ncbi:alpha/beta fold hydrolase [Adhaeribacter aquaticus]|uniref:alpha/beta fold hydrolase n=1 Tax=Adhaeribacter aquaticus TaxID=299567 RepID=UPI000423C117|nr:alpha/beta hydrolase [Adhaeribacter aquaticus]